MSDSNLTTRVRNEFSIYDEERPEVCQGKEHQFRVIACCLNEEDIDILECAFCGKQSKARCNFDDDMS